MYAEYIVSRLIGVGLIIGATLGVLAGIAVYETLTTNNSEIKSGKEFIIENATYKCTKTNELVKGD
jgi:hypothetical protein